MPLIYQRYGETVYILVGKEDELFGEGLKVAHVHEDILRKHSRFFENALNGSWRESRDKRIKLPTDRPACFDIWIQWIYSGHIYSKRGDEMTATIQNEEFNLLCGAYILGDMLQDDDFKDAVLDVLIDTTLSTEPVRLPTTQARYVWENTPPQSSLRKLLIDMVVYMAGAEGFREQFRMGYNEDFYCDALEAMIKYRGVVIDQNQAPFRTNACLYHEHRRKLVHCYRFK